mmetsp:Transcript_24726/g.69419  ORF Transcript_24726/g.69419 Transcript_24726/m.69419 type:complete len:232 (-) Transcript_24726:150-845(-)
MSLHILIQHFASIQIDDESAMAGIDGRVPVRRAGMLMHVGNRDGIAACDARLVTQVVSHKADRFSLRVGVHVACRAAVLLRFLVVVVVVTADERVNILDRQFRVQMNRWRRLPIGFLDADPQLQQRHSLGVVGLVIDDARLIMEQTRSGLHQATGRSRKDDFLIFIVQGIFRSHRPLEEQGDHRMSTMRMHAKVRLGILRHGRLIQQNERIHLVQLVRCSVAVHIDGADHP